MIKADSTVWFSDVAHFDLVQPLPERARVVERLEEAATGLIFAADARSLRELLDETKENLLKPNSLWVAYPKANRADINRDSMWPILAEYGMRPISQVAVDDFWSAIRFRALKPGETPFTAERKAGT